MTDGPTESSAEASPASTRQGADLLTQRVALMGQIARRLIEHEAAGDGLRGAVEMLGQSLRALCVCLLLGEEQSLPGPYLALREIQVRAMREAKACLLVEGASAGDLDLEVLRALHLNTMACHPIVARGQTMGTLSVGREGDGFEAEELALIGEVCQLIGAALGRATANSEIATERDGAIQAAASADTAARARDHLLAMIAHELRTPLTPILAVASAMEADTALPPGSREDAALIRRNAETEARLVEDLLDLARLGRQNLWAGDPTCHDVHDAINQTVAAFRRDPAAANRSILVELRARRYHVSGDCDRIKQVLTNLLRNAVKFTPAGGKVTVRTENGPAVLMLQVIDTGIGMDSARVARISQPTKDIDPHISGSLATGLGLGLVISKMIAEAHGGTLVAASEGVHRGSTFTLTLPLVSGTSAETIAPPASTAGLRILLVEDDADTRFALARLLGRSGHHVTAVAHVSAALAVAEGFDVVICDLTLPDGTGFDLMRQLTARGPVAAIALSGYGAPEDVERCISAGFAEHLSKPVVFAKLQDAIRRVAGKQPAH